MTWMLFGWIFIGVAALLLLLSALFLYKNNYSVRRNLAVEHLGELQSAAMERGEARRVLLGDRFIPLAYPGLDLHALSALPAFLSQESLVDGGLSLGAADGSLAVFARQIVHNSYQDGFSPALPQAGARIDLYGPTPLSFTAGLLPAFTLTSGGSLALFGHYGPEAMLWAVGAHRKNAAVFAAGGDLAAQAVLLLVVEDQLIGESTFAYPHIDQKKPRSASYLMTEDVLRLVLILGLLVGVALKLGGVL